MAVRLSRQPGLFTLMLAEPRWLDPAEAALPLSLALGVTRSDAVRACRLQRGILFEGLTQEQAEAGAAALKEAGVAAAVAPDTEFPLLPKAAEVSLVRITPEAFETPSLVGAGMPRIWPWGDLALMSAGVVLNERGETERLSGGLEPNLLSEQDVRLAQARRRLERVRSRVFPLAQTLQQPEPEAATVIAAAKKRKSPPRRRGLRLASSRDKSAHPEPPPRGEFEGVEILLDLVFIRPFERLRLTTNSRITELPRSALPAKMLHHWVKAMAAHADAATLPGATIAFASGADSGEYVFDNLAQFDDYCRWAYARRLAQLGQG